MNKLIRVLQHLRSVQSINMSLSRGAATSALRQIGPCDPWSWEFAGFSQNGEDGILDLLTRRILCSNRYFIEIGASNGLENNTSWLAVARRWSGLWIEGGQEDSDWCRYVFTSMNYGVEARQMFVTRENAPQLLEAALHTDPDVFSLDIDGNDYYVARALLECGLRPKIFVVEYNSAFGPERAVTIPYQQEFHLVKSHGSNLYYGCSIAGWKKLLAQWNYQFVTVDSNGVNAVFLDPAAFEPEFTRAIQPHEFAENYSQEREYKGGWLKQWELIGSRELYDIPNQVPTPPTAQNTV